MSKKNGFLASFFTTLGCLLLLGAVTKGFENWDISTWFDGDNSEEVNSESNDVSTIGTTLPNSGILLGGIYINDTLSIDEVTNIMDKVMYFESGEGVYTVLYGNFYVGSDEGMVALAFGYSDDTYMIMLSTNNVVDILFDSVNGFYSEAIDKNQGVINSQNIAGIGLELKSELDGFEVGTKNNLITELISYTPYE